MYRFSPCALAAAIGTLSSLNVYADPASASAITEEVVVSASPLNQKPPASLPIDVLTGENLKRDASATLGQTLDQLAGISNSSFGPSVGIPVIRGLSAHRVKLLEGSLDGLDASSTSSDHAVSSEALLADRIEVLRGPQSLRYGSGAIGGVINVINNSIPAEPADSLRGSVESRHNNVNDETAHVFRLDSGSGNWAWHVSGLHRSANNTEIDGFADVHGDEDSSDGFIANTHNKAEKGSLGLAWFGDNTSAGVSVQHMENYYGIPPGGHEHEGHDDDHITEDQEAEEHDDHDTEEHELDEVAENIDIRMRKTRVDFNLSHTPSDSWLTQVDAKLGYVDYTHTELENGVTGTRFASEGVEGRLEMLHIPIGSWRGAMGLHGSTRDFTADGDEAFVPSSRQQNIGLFLIEETYFGPWKVELGARAETQWLDVDDRADKDFQTFSLSSSWLYSLSDNSQVQFIVSRSSRAPSVEELFSDGAHLATQTYDLGDDSLDTEKSHHLELGYHYESRHKFSVNVFYTSFDDFIYKAGNGAQDIESELAVYAFQQQGATFHGAEASATFMISDNLSLKTTGDYVRAELDGGDDVPRMPPVRLQWSLDYTHQQWTLGLGWTHAWKQNRPGPGEESTDGYDRLKAYADFTWMQWNLFIQADNLLNEDIRHSTSYLREVAPEAGRSLTTGVRYRF